MTNSADPDQLASSEANSSGFILLAKTGHVVFSKRRVKKRPRSATITSLSKPLAPLGRERDTNQHAQNKKKNKGKRLVKGEPQSQTAALPRHQEDEETDKTKQAQTEQTYEKH